MADVARFFEDLQNFDINDVDFNRVGVWPVPAKIFVCCLAAAAILGGCYFLMVKDKELALKSEVSKEVKLKKDFERKAHQASNLEAYRLQMDQMVESFKAVVSRLPTETEVPGLLEDISDKGEDSRLEINSIALQRDVKSEFHIESPIQIKVTGDYHQFGSFVSGIAGMPRIVTLHNFSITPKSSGSGQLVMSVTAKTYRYKPRD
ncbi:MAG: type IV pilus assembly protein PilO [Flavobacteriales bacterium]|jgi:type IV pilus assembly protein PilO